MQGGESPQRRTAPNVLVVQHVAISLAAQELILVASLRMKQRRMGTNQGEGIGDITGHEGWGLGRGRWRWGHQRG